ncbi:hypothetical protein SPI_03205 [Niveomyces insectorum RCEF 264]|uniref:Uncharacterized protein n=1 Tax=Niveomyces insectorum RCEF 264 TaxID=1081102 RepID=A0A167X5M8_9HYPO|nr:hypothetical protein SPI_03205 [Niveomyces insectorum RCEF 264]
MADQQVSSWTGNSARSFARSFANEPLFRDYVQNVAAELSMRWRRSVHYLNRYIDVNEENATCRRDGLPETTGDALNYKLAAVHDLLQRDLVFCKWALGASEAVFSSSLRFRMIVAGISTCVKVSNALFGVFSRNPAGDVILWGLLATFLPLTLVSILGARLTRSCVVDINAVQALLRTHTLREEHRDALSGTKWATTRRLLDWEASISSTKGYLKGYFQRRVD